MMENWQLISNPLINSLIETYNIWYLFQNTVFTTDQEPYNVITMKYFSSTKI